MTSLTINMKLNPNTGANINRQNDSSGEVYLHYDRSRMARPNEHDNMALIRGNHEMQVRLNAQGCPLVGCKYVQSL
jgi:hypothetical protein